MRHGITLSLMLDQVDNIIDCRRKLLLQPGHQWFRVNPEKARIIPDETTYKSATRQLLEIIVFDGFQLPDGQLEPVCHFAQTQVGTFTGRLEHRADTKPCRLDRIAEA